MPKPTPQPPNLEREKAALGAKIPRLGAVLTPKFSRHFPQNAIKLFGSRVAFIILLTPQNSNIRSLITDTAKPRRTSPPERPPGPFCVRTTRTTRRERPRVAPLAESWNATRAFPTNAPTSHPASPSLPRLRGRWLGAAESEEALPICRPPVLCKRSERAS